MRAKELKLMSEPELENKVVELRKELMKAYSQVAIGTIPKNPSKIKEIKKTIAKILTFGQKNSKKEVAKRNE